MNKIRKLAVRGMRGRRKDTRVLALVIGMGFLFLTAGTLLLSSFHGSQAQQRQSLYGDWHLLYGGGDTAVCQSLEGLSQADEAVTVTMLGSDEKCGHVAVWDEDFAQLGNLQILEGRAPEAEGEILLERGQLGLFSEEIGVGSQISLTMNYHMEDLRERQYLTPSISIRGGELPARQVMETFGDGVTEEGIQSVMERVWTEEVWNRQYTYKDENGELHTEWAFDAPLRCPISEMDDESYRTAVLGVAQSFSYLNDYLEYTVRDEGETVTTEVNRSFFEGDSHGAVKWGLNTQYDYLYAKSAQFASEELQQIVMTRGAVPTQDLNLTRSCTVVGIIETVSDRWDVGDVVLPNCYISTPTAEEFRETAAQLQTREEPRLQRPLEEQTLLFLRGNGTLSSLYGQVQEMGIPLVREVSVDAYHRAMDSDAWKSDYGYEVEEEDWETVQWQLEEMQQADPSLDGISLTGLELVSNRYYAVWLERIGREGSHYKEEVYLHRPVFQWELSDGSTRLEDGWLAYLMLPTQISNWESQMSVYYRAWSVPFQALENGEISFSLDESGSYQSAPGGLPDLTEGYTYNQGQILLNRYGYPLEGGLTGMMGAAMIGVIMVITVCAVFQIFFTQLRRRTKKLTLLKSVGATHGQIFALLAWECVYITIGSLVLGDALGVAVALGVTQALEGVSFFLDWPLVLAGQACGILAVILGMLMPSLKSMHTPLVGRMEGHKRRHVRVRAWKRQTWSRLCARDRAGNPGRTMGMALLCLFLVALELICVFLGNASFDTYRQTIQQTDKPDYTLLSNHTGSRRETDALLEKLGRAEGLSRVDFWQREDHIFLWYDGMEKSPVLSALKQAGGDSFFAESKADTAQQTEEGFLTQAYGVDGTSDLYARLEAAFTEGSVDPAAFEEGKEVILLLPMHRPLQGSGEGNESSMADFLRSTGTMDLSLAASAAQGWERDSSIQVGDSLTLAVDCPRLADTSVYYTQTVQKVTVGAIIRYFQEQGVWPFAGSPQSHVVIGSSKLLYGLYSEGFKTMTERDLAMLETRKNWLYTYNYGEAGFSLYAGEHASTENTLTPLFQISRENHLTLGNLHDSNQAVYNKALSSCLLMGMLAFAATVIVWMILRNTLASAQEQGRKRTGILQALGVTKAQMYRAQAFQALRYWLIAMAGAHGVLVVAVLISGWMQRMGQGFTLMALLQAIVQEDLAAYPWMLHVGLCLLELPVLLLFHLLTLRGPLQSSPTENIRS